MNADRWLTPTDLRLLRTLNRVPNLVRASRKAGIPRDRAVYRLQRLRRLYGKPAAVGRRGGGAVGATTLTRFGRSLVRSIVPVHSGVNRWQGVYWRGPTPHVDLGNGCRVEVVFRARSGAAVTIEVDPESFVIARRRFESSARNVFEARLETVRPLASGPTVLTARWKGLPVRATVTSGSVRRLRLVEGQLAYFYLKAVAVRKT